MGKLLNEKVIGYNAQTAVTGGLFVKRVVGGVSNNDTTGGRVAGVAREDQDAGRRVGVFKLTNDSFIPVTTGAAITEGALIMSDDDGKAIPHTGNNVAVGVAEEAATAADQEIKFNPIAN